MHDSRLDRWADVLVNYSLALKPGELLVIDAQALAAPLVRAVYRAALAAGAVPETSIALDGLEEDFLKRANDTQLAFVSPIRRTAVEQADAFLYLRGTANTRELSGLDPERLRKRSQANRAMMDRFYERCRRGELRWCLTVYPTPAQAQEADMSLTDFEEFVFAACHLNDPDPLAHWRQVEAEQARIVEYLSRKSEFRIVAPDTDLTFSAGGRKWENACGKVNFPDGEVFTSPVEGSVEGRIRFSFPGIFRGQAIEDIRLTFKEGRVAEASARTGESLLHALIATDEGARVPGEFAIGTNFAITRQVREMLFDEKMGGTIHLALGRSVGETGGRNQSAIHWDMLCDVRQDAALYADGEKFYENGRFLVPLNSP
ncbi:MAG: aminopeptidase [Betaproteobacteria bacterium]